MKLTSDWYLGEPPHVSAPGGGGFSLGDIGSDVQKTIVFIGFAHNGSPGGIRCTGTAFLVLYQGQGYLVTARHCVEPYEGRDYLLRVNTKTSSRLLRTPEGTNWTYHADPRIDVAVLAAALVPEHGYDTQYITEDSLHPRWRKD